MWNYILYHKCTSLITKNIKLHPERSTKMLTLNHLKVKGIWNFTIYLMENKRFVLIKSPQDSPRWFIFPEGSCKIQMIRLQGTVQSSHYIAIWIQNGEHLYNKCLKLKAQIIITNKVQNSSLYFYHNLLCMGSIIQWLVK